ncbi:unnamed protein product [Orchesella dallaii]|uniref:RZ-type domain-containing protein n=1 Tax=Orchesella dallaii TaxID=48710 RepID=A0ABP1S773_9HEXA
MDEHLSKENDKGGNGRWLPVGSTKLFDTYQIPWPPPLPMPPEHEQQIEVDKEEEEEEPIRLSKFHGKAQISGFRSNCIVVFHDERILLKKERNGRTFKQITPDLISYQQLKMGLEVAKYLEKNGVRDFRLLSNDVIGLRVMENELKKMKIGIQDAPSSPAHEVDPLRRKVNSTEVTILLLFHFSESSQPEFQREMGKVLKTAIRASRAGIIVLATVGLLPLEKLKDPTLRQLLSSLITENNIQLQLHYEYLLEFFQHQLMVKLTKKLDSQRKSKEADCQVKIWEITKEDMYSFKDVISNALSILAPTSAPKNNLELYCFLHSFIHTTIFNSSDLQYASPTGGCREFCEKKLKCGRLCRFPCHPLDNYHHSEAFQCEDHWVSQLCLAEGHLTIRKCWDERCHEETSTEFSCVHLVNQYQGISLRCYEKSALQCEIPVIKELPCGHGAYAECWNKLEGFQCPILVPKELPICRHSVSAPCFQPVDNFPCSETVSTFASCGTHKRETKCQNMRLGIELKCLVKCEKMCPRQGHKCEKEHSCLEPCPPCLADVQWNLICGHSVLKLCYEELYLETFQCNQPCKRVNVSCEARHFCCKLCYEDCGECRHKVPTKVKGCREGHYIKPMCFEAAAKSMEPCVFPVVAKKHPPCGHEVRVPCHMAEKLSKEEVQKRCDVKCKHIFMGEAECGHVCQGNCYTCYQGRFHQRCEEPCGRILICGHACAMPCSKVCPPCSRPCYNKCEHFECDLECGVPCSITCEEPCPYQCEHSSCSKLCSEVCDKPICSEPCKLLLKCGHPCIGFCGEICPPYCHVCSPEKILNDPFFQRDEDEKKGTVRFLFLPDCGHCLDSHTMDMWMGVEASSEDEIQPKLCPICRTRITSFRRYSEVMNRNRQLIDSIRQRMYGDAEEITRSLKTVEELLTGYVVKCERDDQVYLGYLLSWLEAPIYLDKAKFLEWISNEWISVHESLLQFSGKLPQYLLHRFRDYWTAFLDIVFGRFWPLHPNEMGDFQVERRRMDEAISLYKRMSSGENPLTFKLARSKQGMKRIRDAEDVLFAAKPYGKSQRDLVTRKLEELEGILKVTVKLTEEEKKEVVGAFGGRPGRWFKCCNGHVYVITECGGAMEKGNCPECGVEIGGLQHSMAEWNYLATEMDGAQVAIWPNAMDRPERVQWVAE